MQTGFQSVVLAVGLAPPQKLRLNTTRGRRARPAKKFPSAKTASDVAVSRYHAGTSLNTSSEAGHGFATETWLAQYLQTTMVFPSSKSQVFHQSFQQIKKKLCATNCRQNHDACRESGSVRY